MVKLLFVCLGNICRSPSGEAVMNHFIEQRGLSKLIECDSAGTYGGHAGEPADSRMQRHAILRGYDLTSRSRQIKQKDLEHFDYIIAMDNSNLRNISNLDKKDIYSEKIVKMTDYCSRCAEDEVPDPYYGGAAGFEHVLDILEDACEGLLNEVVDKHL